MVLEDGDLLIGEEDFEDDLEEDEELEEGELTNLLPSRRS